MEKDLTLKVDGESMPINYLEDNQFYIYIPTDQKDSNERDYDKFSASGVAQGSWIRQSVKNGFNLSCREFYTTLKGKPLAWKAAGVAA